MFNISVKLFGQIFKFKKWILLMKTNKDWVNLEYEIGTWKGTEQFFFFQKNLLNKLT